MQHQTARLGFARGLTPCTFAEASVLMPGIEATLQEKLNEIVSSVQREEESLKAERQAIKRDREAMEADHTSKKAKLDQERATFEAEKEAVAVTNQVLRSKVKLDVGGTIYHSSRTTLTSVPGSMLEAMFSGRHAVEEDEDGRVFIDRDGATFKLVLEYLRSPTSFSLDGLSKREVASCLVEFEYYGLPPPVPPLPPLDLKMNVCQNGCASVQLYNDKCTVFQETTDGDWAWAIGADVLADDAVWKMRVNQLPDDNDLMMGVVANATSDSNDVQTEETFAGWYMKESFYAAGSDEGSSGWPGWQSGDEAIFALNASARTLTVHLKRFARTYTYTNLAAGHEGQWRVAVDMYNNTNVVLSQPTAEEVALVK